MGQRIIVTVEALLRANCTLVQKIVHHPAIVGIQPFDAFDEELLKVTFPCGAEWIADFATHGDRMWIEADFNAWGSVKPRIEPLLLQYKIFHIVH